MIRFDVDMPDYVSNFFSKNKLSVLFLPIFVGIGLFLSLFLFVINQGVVAEWLLIFLIILGSVPLILRMIASIRKGALGVDVIAACALIGSVIFHEYVAGAVILLMLSGGEALEEYALARASRQLTHLLSRAPKFARRKSGQGIEEVAVGKVRPGDILVVATGDVLPVDGVVMEGAAVLDESALTGEPLPVEKKKYMLVMSGSVSKGQAFVMKALKNSDESAYGRIVALVRNASESRPPIVRIADQYAVFFTILTLVFAVVAWLISGDPVRILAVLVVATPCPLILAVPIAVMSAISAAAKRGIVVKDGGALERLAKVKTFIFDKTGTVTFGVPDVLGIRLFEVKNGGSGFTENAVLRFAASLEQLSNHVIAQSIRDEAVKRAIHLPYPEEVSEIIGRGVRGVVEGVEVAVGSIGYFLDQKIGYEKEVEVAHQEVVERGEMAVMVACSGKMVGMIILGDAIREESRGLMKDLFSLGAKRIVMLTGDKKRTAQYIAAQLGVSEVKAECTPEQKVQEVKRLRAGYPPVAMVGDGINDAPALAAADVGVAMTSRGETAATDAADIVITVDSIERTRDVFIIAKHMLRVAKEGVFFGIGASVVLMVFAAAGMITPVYGALMQEGIDVLVILNALRVLHTQKLKKY